ncbi:MAG: hypothetical protein IH963_09795 [Chloroflexi bacterium]|nr:hypothetical protein [Chloroflexota bacterium]
MTFGPDSVGSILSHRGFRIEATGDYKHLLFPWELRTGIGDGLLEASFSTFAKSSFRKFARHLTSHDGGSTLGDLQKIAGEETEVYVQYLCDLGIADSSNNQVILTRQIDNIGPTLEWYVANVCQSQFEGSAAWSVKLEDMRYGDFDVLAWLPPTLLYVETKSSRPEEIKDTEIKHFLQRGVELAPDLAILLVDTDDDLEDSGFLHKIYGIMLPTISPGDEARVPVSRDTNELFIEPQRGYSGISWGYRRFYVTNSKPSIETQLRKCLRHFNARVKHTMFASGPPLNFVTGEIEEY